MYHVATLMNLGVDDLDKELTNKKKHVGNDHLHIVWNENKRKYGQNTIISQFNNVLIIINHVENLNLYSIRIKKK